MAIWGIRSAYALKCLGVKYKTLDAGNVERRAAFDIKTPAWIRLNERKEIVSMRINELILTRFSLPNFNSCFKVETDAKIDRNSPDFMEISPKEAGDMNPAFTYEIPVFDIAFSYMPMRFEFRLNGGGWSQGHYEWWEANDYYRNINTGIIHKDNARIDA